MGRSARDLIGIGRQAWLGVAVFLWGIIGSPAVQALEAGKAEPGEEGPALAAAYGVKIADPAPPRSEGQGPFDTLIITNVMLINGEGSPPMGPVNVRVEGNRIAAISAVAAVEPGDGIEILDGTGMYALPGFVDAHTHIGTVGQGLTGPLTPPEYVFKLWLGHGITTVRETGAGMGLDWTLARSPPPAWWFTACSPAAR